MADWHDHLDSARPFQGGVYWKRFLYRNASERYDGIVCFVTAAAIEHLRSIAGYPPNSDAVAVFKINFEKIKAAATKVYDSNERNIHGEVVINREDLPGETYVPGPSQK